MVQIIVKLVDDPKEWALVELQGFLETDHEDLAGLHIGDLHFDTRGVPNLIIGHHVLQGKVTKIDKPFAVMKKKRNNSMNEEVMELTDKNKTGTSYDVVAIVKSKIIFKNRPRPIIVKQQPRKIT